MTETKIDFLAFPLARKRCKCIGCLERKHSVSLLCLGEFMDVSEEEEAKVVERNCTLEVEKRSKSARLRTHQAGCNVRILHVP
jgi:hypothetical protein